MTLTANLIRVAPNMLQAALADHPVATTLVRLQELTPGGARHWVVGRQHPSRDRRAALC
jgi:hypothetical protein